MYRSFESDLEKLRSRLVRMGSLVEEQVEFAVRCITEDKQELAEIVLERDDKIDKLNLKIDKQCQRIFALHQPVASDLRLLLVALKMSTELERIGDQAFNMARGYREYPALHSLNEKISFNLFAMHVYKMVKWSLNAFISNDPQLALQIMRSDAQIDASEKDLIRRTKDAIRENTDLLDTGIQMILILRGLERIADQTTNIAESVIFLVEAKAVRYNSGIPVVAKPDRDDDDANDDDDIPDSFRRMG